MITWRRTNWKHLPLGIVLGFFLLGSWLRIYKYAEFPVAAETQDEVAWTMLGASLLQEGKPSSWSHFSSYTNKRPVTLGTSSFTLVSPALDHPPLFSLLPGLATTLRGDRWDVLPSYKAIRAPMILLSVVNLALGLWWLRLYFSRQLVAQFVASAVWATVPSFVFLNRLVVSENLLITWMLLSFIIAIYAGKRSFSTLKWSLFVVQLLFPLTKIAGIALAGANILLWWQQDRRYFRWALGGLVAGILVLLGYVWWWDWSLFLSVQLEQTARNVGFLSVLNSQVWSRSLVAKEFADAFPTISLWLVIGWLFWQHQVKKLDRTTALAMYFFIANLGFIAMTVGEQTVHGWYRLPFWPVYVLAWGSVMEQVWEKKSGVALATLWLLMAGQVRLALLTYWETALRSWQSLGSKVWHSLAGVLVLVEAYGFSEKVWKRFWQYAAIALVVVVIVSNITTIVRMKPVILWQDELYLEQGL